MRIFVGWVGGKPATMFVCREVGRVGNFEALAVVVVYVAPVVLFKGREFIFVVRRRFVLHFVAPLKIEC